MDDVLLMHYDWLRALHIIAVICWMAGLLYLPRLFVYHCGVEKGSDASETFKIMERKLMNLIMRPSMVAAWIFGLLMLYANPGLLEGQGWMHAKLLLVVMMSLLHEIYAKHLKAFAKDENQKSEKYYRIINEGPALLMVLIVIFAVVEPF